MTRRAWTLPTLRAIHERWSKGEPLADIAAEYGTTYSNMHLVLRYHGLTCQHRRTSPRGMGFLNESDRLRLTPVIRFARARRHEGWTWPRIVKAAQVEHGYSATPDGIRRLVKKHGEKRL